MQESAASAPALAADLLGCTVRGTAEVARRRPQWPLHVPLGVGQMQLRNGIAADQLAVRWRKSRASNPSGSCVEFAELPDGAVAVRNSRFPSGPALICARPEVAAFLAGLKNGEFDDLCHAPELTEAVHSTEVIPDYLDRQ